MQIYVNDIGKISKPILFNQRYIRKYSILRLQVQTNYNYFALKLFLFLLNSWMTNLVITQQFLFICMQYTKYPAVLDYIVLCSLILQLSN